MAFGPIERRIGQNVSLVLHQFGSLQKPRPAKAQVRQRICHFARSNAIKPGVLIRWIIHPIQPLSPQPIAQIRPGFAKQRSDHPARHRPNPRQAIHARAARKPQQHRFGLIICSVSHQDRARGGPQQDAMAPLTRGGLNIANA